MERYMNRTDTTEEDVQWEERDFIPLMKCIRELYNREGPFKDNRIPRMTVIAKLLSSSFNLSPKVTSHDQYINAAIDHDFITGDPRGQWIECRALVPQAVLSPAAAVVEDSVFARFVSVVENALKDGLGQSDSSGNKWITFADATRLVKDAGLVHQIQPLFRTFNNFIDTAKAMNVIDVSTNRSQICLCSKDNPVMPMATAPSADAAVQPTSAEPCCTVYDDEGLAQLRRDVHQKLLGELKTALESTCTKAYPLSDLSNRIRAWKDVRQTLDLLGLQRRKDIILEACEAGLMVLREGTEEDGPEQVGRELLALPATPYTAPKVPQPAAQGQEQPTPAPAPVPAPAPAPQPAPVAETPEEDEVVIETEDEEAAEKELSTAATHADPFTAFEVILRHIAEPGMPIQLCELKSVMKRDYRNFSKSVLGANYKSFSLFLDAAQERGLIALTEDTVTLLAKDEDVVAEQEEEVERETEEVQAEAEEEEQQPEEPVVEVHEEPKKAPEPEPVREPAEPTPAPLQAPAPVETAKPAPAPVSADAHFATQVRPFFPALVRSINDTADSPGCAVPLAALAPCFNQFAPRVRQIEGYKLLKLCEAAQDEGIVKVLLPSATRKVHYIKLKKNFVKEKKPVKQPKVEPKPAPAATPAPAPVHAPAPVPAPLPAPFQEPAPAPVVAQPPALTPAAQPAPAPLADAAQLVSSAVAAVPQATGLINTVAATMTSLISSNGQTDNVMLAKVLLAVGAGILLGQSPTTLAFALIGLALVLFHRAGYSITGPRRE
ncbi:hypothetical protein J8273_2499 [Carpediemonas membranifera]|uniref:Uncharacterized protein n=1 Tax=Carpediemonas membranifera TaxID=201153 RepID=A0A8J6BF40_9EUKA|nr:hypothetical protein J8273_2499 [Carpediemonas membranifera]|eukprot:KAG9396147.1 hypothetical protein J8273_2499 [Carpediemonas membranifera]